MKRNPESTGKRCVICRMEKPEEAMIALSGIRPPVLELIRKTHPEVDLQGSICLSDFNRFRILEYEQVLAGERQQLSDLERKVLQSVSDNTPLTRNLNEQYEEQIPLGARIADRVALFGGSWRFILIFSSVILLWIAVNSFLLLSRAFDPFPFILLNLVLSCLAALQAPVIMMSQNRQAAKDRIRAEQDFMTNLKAEVEIRLLNEKMDHLLYRQLPDLLEAQDLVMGLLNGMNREKEAVR